ncbi:phage head-tail adapter protein [Desulfosporosinus sp. Tol-M]|nr:phage head-tail adapter protein [Desulfosporosinus sp. Tol-M]
MSYGKMNTFIEIISTAPTKDTEGFVTHGDTILASIRAYKEDRHGNERWANMAAFSEATAMFRFRKIPALTVDTAMFIICDGCRYNIVSAEDVRNRGMYVEVMATEVKPSG